MESQVNQSLYETLKFVAINVIFEVVLELAFVVGHYVGYLRLELLVDEFQDLIVAKAKDSFVIFLKDWLHLLVQHLLNIVVVLLVAFIQQIHTLSDIADSAVLAILDRLSYLLEQLVNERYQQEVLV